MGLLDPLVRPRKEVVEERYSALDYFQQAAFAYNGSMYGMSMNGSRPDVPDQTFQGYIDGIHRRNGVVAAAVEARALAVSQMRFRWRNPDGDLFGNRALRSLEKPGGVDTRAAFLHRLETDVAYSGTAYVAMVDGQVRRLRPDKCSVVLGSNSAPEWTGENDLSVPADADVIGLLYHPNEGSARTWEGVEVFMPGEFTCWSPEPDPIHFWRGVSWVTSVIREVIGHSQAVDHQKKFFENAATPNLVFLMDPSKTPAETKEYAEITNRLHTGTNNAYKNMFVGGGTDVKVIGSTLESLNLKDLSGGFETTVAMRARIPGVILGIREGYAGSSLNAGNYGQARRLFADSWFASHADSLCEALERIVPPPSEGVELTYDPDRILILQEDQQDAANILSTKGGVLRTLIDGGFDPATAVEAVTRGDLSKLEHSGKLSVQLQEPGNGEGDAFEDGADDDSSDDEPVGERSRQMRGEQFPAVTNVHVNMSEQRHTIEVPAQDAPVVHVTNEITERAQEPPTINVEAPSVTVEAPEIRMEEREINIHVDPTPVVIENTIETPRSKHKVRRDSKGNITEIEERPV